MKILLLRTARIKQAVTLGEFMYCEPIGLECVYAVLKEKYTLEILDLMIKDEDFEAAFNRFKPDVVGITSLCIDVKEVLKVARRTKELNPIVKVFVGGTQALLRPQSFFSENVDYVFKYTTTENLRKVMIAVEDIENLGDSQGKLIDGVHSKVLEFKSTEKPGRNEYIIPDRESTNKYRKYYSYLGYRPCAILQTSLGCRKRCDFCLRWRMEGDTEDDIDIKLIIKLIGDIKEPSIMIYDNDFLNNNKRLLEFCELLEKEGIKKNFLCYGSVRSIIDNEEAVRKFVKNGLKAVLVGYESFKQNDLREYLKKSTIDDSLKASIILKDAGVDCWASFILNPDWDTNDFKQLKKYIKRLKPQITTFSPLTPFVGLPLHEKFKDRLLCGIEDYEQWSFSKVTIKPDKMSIARYYFETLRLVLLINLRMNSTTYMLKRFGFATLLRIGVGSVKILPKYISFMINAFKNENLGDKK